MPSPLLTILPGVLRAIAKLFGGRIADAADAITSGSLSPEKRAELTLALQEHERALRAFDVEEMRALMTESVVMLQSTDKFTSRARPFGIYAASVITLALAVAMIFGIQLDTSAIVAVVTPLWGQAAWYTWNRTKEKMDGRDSG